MEKLLTPQEVAPMLGMSVAALAQLRYTGKGPAYKALTPRKIRYTESDVADWVQSSTRTGTALAAS